MDALPKTCILFIGIFAIIASGGWCQAPTFQYNSIWASQDGATHFSECTLSGFVEQNYVSGGTQTYNRGFGIPKPNNVSFLALQPGQFVPWHSPPNAQFVVVNQGILLVEVSDGQQKNFTQGQVIFHDNTKSSPASGNTVHQSGNSGSDVMVMQNTQVDYAPQVDIPCPF